MKFDLFCTKPIIENNEILRIDKVKLIYDNINSTLEDEQGNKFSFKKFEDFYYSKINHYVSEQTPSKKKDIELLKIQLGLSCNYSCTYCSQRFVPNAAETNSSYIDKFMKSLDLWLFKPPKRIEFWGGEPFVYWKTLKPLAEELRKKYPLARFIIVSNGSIITKEIVDWLDELDFHIGISHDGPGQSIRGPDPFENEEQKKILLYLLEKRKGKISFNATLSKNNFDRKKIQEYFKEIIGHEDFVINEGHMIDVYDEGGKECSFSELKEHYEFRRQALFQIRDKEFLNFEVYNGRIREWVASIANERNAMELGQKCGMDKETSIAVDLRGNVLTCQNVSAVSTAPNGRSHLLGHVSKLDEVKLRTATHWKFREECLNCPVLQACKGSCMFLQDEYFKISCDSAYSDHIPFFATAIEILTGCLPYHIEAHKYPLKEERKNLWG